MIDKLTLQLKLELAQQQQREMVANLNMIVGAIKAYELLLADIDADTDNAEDMEVVEEA